MKNEQNEREDRDGASEGKQDKKAEVTSLSRMEMYAVLGLELGQRIIEKLQKVEDSVEILARQKARDLNPEERDTEPTP